MRRTLATIVAGLALIGPGCSGRYDFRMEHTIEAMKYARQLDKELGPPPTEGPLKEKAIYLRAPKGLEPAKEFQLTALQPGAFDVERTYFQGTKSFLHVLARVKTPKKAPAKGAAPVEQATRGAFNDDVVAVLKSVYGDDDSIAVAKFKDDKFRDNTFKKATFTANGKKVEAYIYKADPYDVAMIYVFDPADEVALKPKIRLGLESFAVNDKARNKFAGATTDEEANEAPTTGVVF